jgi:hypothetical protein
MQVQQWVADGLACTAGDGGLVGDHSRAGQVLRTTYQQVVDELFIVFDVFDLQPCWTCLFTSVY